MPVERTLPPWFKVPFPGGPNYLRLRTIMREHGLHTICEEARCPNMGECWEYGTATFLILGDTCTRSCAFCAVTTGKPKPIDPLEPERLAQTVKLMGLRYAVITSVNRDDAIDGGASVFARSIARIRELTPDCKVEVLIPDFMGNWDALAEVMRARPDVLNHNIETVPRLYHRVRTKARYERSLELLDRAKELAPDALTKSGLMVGLGETREELEETMADLRDARVDILTIGQYLRPTKEPRHVPIARFYTPEEFVGLREVGLALGFRHVESGPLVRSSYHAHEQVEGPRVGAYGHTPLRSVDDHSPATKQGPALLNATLSINDLAHGPSGAAAQESP